jgi:hypothetical protein
MGTLVAAREPMALVSFRHAFFVAFVAPAVVVAACSGSGGSLSLADYDTSCTVASDCVPVLVNPTGCCDCPSAAINKADVAKYEAALAAKGQPTCNVECGACPDTVTVCSHGTCGVALPLGTGGGSVACGTTTCTGGEVCVMNQFEGGAVMSPNDAGMCPDGDVNNNNVCNPEPTYHCAPAPACPSGLSCTCAQSLCQSSYTCQEASQGLVKCLLAAP